MSVIATAGHVDHGKSALVRALTGIEPDRWEAERRRGLTIDLGYAWTTLPGAGTVAFVDVPGHRRFIGNMLSGIGPAAGVLLVVAADGGWSAQSTEHLRAAHALRLEHGVLAVTRSDLADPDPTLAESRSRLRGTSLDGIPAVTVSARTGTGLEGLREELAALARRMPRPPADSPVRLWVDRSFTVRGAGTVVTGTLAAGTVRPGDHLALTTLGGRERDVVVRGVHSMDRAVEAAAGPARVALNLRGVDVEDVGRGQTLLSPDHSWWPTVTADVLLDDDELPAEVTAHVGTAAVSARLRLLAGRHARVSWQTPVPLAPGDRLILRDPGREGSLVGALVLDAITPPLRRTGAARARASALTAAAGATTTIAGRAVSRATASAWQLGLADLLARRADADPLTPWVEEEAALTELRRRVGMPDLATLRAVASGSGLRVEGGRLVRHGSAAPQVSSGLDALLQRLAEDPLDAPSRPELAALGLGVREIAAAARSQSVLRLPGDVLLGSTAPTLAVGLLRDLPQPFTAAQARERLGTSRRVLIPLLEHLDARGRTHRGADGLRTVTASG
ncbi:selenocysteine-specific translation elongation factor [uncultured Serinicoccus sp.]|uniref:selenocysteine-specific translation elongation factor n=1 Tax=uncultured Serinicoccus sp. TaxID=735514 RepID=UPI00260FE11F|nr:selenocysteine-specific translation elongation factor [uncultured Serinicoccus sp.]